MSDLTCPQCQRHVCDPGIDCGDYCDSHPCHQAAREVVEAAVDIVRKEDARQRALDARDYDAIKALALAQDGWAMQTRAVRALLSTLKETT